VQLKFIILMMYISFYYIFKLICNMSKPNRHSIEELFAQQFGMGFRGIEDMKARRQLGLENATELKVLSNNNGGKHKSRRRHCRSKSRRSKSRRSKSRRSKSRRSRGTYRRH
jgi:hypothetical protein